VTIQFSLSREGSESTVKAKRIYLRRNLSWIVDQGALKTRRILNSPNRGGTNADLPVHPNSRATNNPVQSAQFVQRQTCKHLRSLGSDQKTPSFTEKEETCVGPLCSQIATGLSPFEFFTGVITVPNLEQSQEERMAPLTVPFYLHAGGATVCRRDGAWYCI